MTPDFDSLPLDIIRQIVNSSSDPEKLFEAMPDQTLEIYEPQTRLVKAATLGSIKHVKTALRDGADPNVSVDATHCKNLALHAAICHKHINIVVHLLEIGADPALEDQMDSANLLHRTNVYQTALHRAVKTGNEELVSLILDTKVDVELGQRTIEHCSEDDRRKLEKKNKPTSWITKETPLEHACGRLHPNMAIIKMLVEHGADVNAGYIPPLCLAICRPWNRELITYLLEVGADVNKPGWVPFPQSALTRILDMHDNDLKVQLLEAGADPNFNEALIIQALKGKDENVELLLRYGADPNLKGRWDGKTALESVKHKLDHETRWSECGARRPGPVRKSMKKIAKMLGDDFVYSTSDDEKDGPILYTEHCRRERKRFMEMEEREEEKRKRKRQKREERETLTR